MKLGFDTYKDKVRGCWLGKNIGGVLGAPFEGRRQVNDVSFYVQDLKGSPPANDDLDLQLVWLNAVERFGRQVNAEILGEYWLSFILPDWVEYGAGKNNLRMGFAPPLSGHMENPYRNSCGCFIRSELWACLAPGRPDLAVRYAFEDAIVDHAAEGLYGEVFCAALQSAAFVESNAHRLIEIGLSYVPKDCGVSQGIRTALETHRSGADFLAARKNVLTAVPGFFGVNMTPVKDVPPGLPVGEPGYDAPSNVALMIVGWLYGGDDFGRSLCTAANCGEDTDCTCATLGATLGIINGARGIPADWVAPIGDVITTCCVNLTNMGIDMPRTVTELTERILRAAPLFLGRQLCDLLAGPERYTIEALEPHELLCEKEARYFTGSAGNWKSKEPLIAELLSRSPFAVTRRFPVFTAVLDYGGDPSISAGEPRRLRLTVYDNGVAPMQKWVNVTLYLPDGVTASPGRSFSFFLQDLYRHKVELEFELHAERIVGSRVEFVVDLSLNGRHSNGQIKGMLVAR